MKRKTKRSSKKYPALEPRVNSRVRQEYNDYDYIDKLSEEEKQWLNDFTEEYLNASVGKQSEAENNRFHNTPELVKERTDQNNARNRDLYGRIRNKVGNTKLLNYDDTINIVEEHLSRGVKPDSIEDAIIEYLDKKLVKSEGNRKDNGDDTK